MFTGTFQDPPSPPKKKKKKKTITIWSIFGYLKKYFLFNALSTADVFSIYDAGNLKIISKIKKENI